MTDTQIRRVQANMLDTLVFLERQTFIETFSSNYPGADLENYLQEKKSAEALLREVEAPGSLYFVIYHDGEAAGFLKVNLGKQPDDVMRTRLPEPVMEVEKIYVLRSFQGYKLGRALMQKAYEIAREYGVRSIWLGVWEHNVRAQGFYEAEGFSRFSEHKFMVGRQEDTDWLMSKEL